MTATEPKGVEQDPRVYEAMIDLAVSTIKRAKEILDSAAPQQQLNLIRMMLPPLMRSMSQGGEDDLAELRKQVAGMNEMVEKALGTDG